MRVGPKMREVLAYVSEHPGCTKLAPALVVAPHGRATAHFGYRVVDRCIRAGLLVAHRVHTSRYELRVAS